MRQVTIVSMTPALCSRSIRLLAGLLAATAAVAAPATYVIDPAQSSAQFAVTHLMVNTVKGQFSTVRGMVEYDPQNPSAAKIDATVDVSSIDTRVEKRDAHLKSADFFDVEKFPTMRFVSKRVLPAAPGKLKLLGDLTIHGITREVTLDVNGPLEGKDAPGGLRMRASATTSISRKAFGLTWNKLMETGGVVVGDPVQITVDVALIRKP
jgi:polyisoprenoid-binding protein YceI